MQRNALRRGSARTRVMIAASVSLAVTGFVPAITAHATSPTGGPQPAVAPESAVAPEIGWNRPTANSATTDGDAFTMVVMSDPQYPWWPTRDMPTGCDYNRADHATANVSGDLIWNRDAQECAAELENSERVAAIKAVTSANGGTWPVDAPGTTFPLYDNDNGGEPIDEPAGVIINGDLTAFFHGWQVEKYLEYYQDQLEGIPVLAGLGNHDYSNNFEDCAGNGCYEDAIDLMRRMVTGARVANFPNHWVQSFDPSSLSYSWGYENYVFIQLNNYSSYVRGSGDYEVGSSSTWLKSELERATAADKRIVLLMHDYEPGEDYSDADDPNRNEFDANALNAIAASNTVALFVGHDSGVGKIGELTNLANNAFTNAYGDLIPYFRSGHSGTATDRKFLLVEFEDDRMTVGTIDAAAGSPSFHLPSTSTKLDTYDFSSTTTPASHDYGFVAVGVPDEDVYNSTNSRQNDAGAVNAYYRGDHGTFGQQWTQGGFFDTAVEADDRHGSSLAVGDFDGDGYPDLASGAPGEDVHSGPDDAGVVTIAYGTSTGVHRTRARGVITQVETLSESQESNDRFGQSLTAGDFNGDGYDDLAVGVPREDLNCDNKGDEEGDDAGLVNVWYGSSSGINGSGYTVTQATTGGTCNGGAQFGFALTTGDFNNDGRDDLAIGAPYADVAGDNDAGLVTVVPGGATGLNSAAATRWSQDDLGDETEGDDRFGFSLAAGDFNGDGYDDLAGGAPGEDINCDFNGGEEGDDAGMINVWHGGTTGIAFRRPNADGLSRKLDGRDLTTSSDRWERCEGDDHFGWSLAAGDLNNDGYDELAVGAPQEDIGSNDVGGVIVLIGRYYEFNDRGYQRLYQEPMTNNTGESGDLFGQTLAIGDLDLDGYDDLAVTAYGEDGGVGQVDIFLGGRAACVSGGRTFQCPLSNPRTIRLQQDAVALDLTDGENGNDRFGAALAIGSFVPPANQPPTADAGADRTVVEGDAVTLVGIAGDPDAGDVTTAEWSLGSATDTSTSSGCNPATIAPVASTTLSFTPLNDCAYELVFVVTDTAGASVEDRVVVTVENADPVATITDVVAFPEGSNSGLQWSFTDAGADDNHTVTIDWGDPNDAADTVLQPSSRSGFTRHLYKDDGSYTARLCVSDGDGGEHCVDSTIDVANVKPTITVDPVVAVTETNTTSVSGSFFDPGSLDTHTATIDWGDGTGTTPLDVTGRSFDETYTYVDDDEDDQYTITICVTDDDGADACTTATAGVTNVAPEVTFPAITPVLEGETTTIDGTYSDVNSVDTHTMTIDWDVDSGNGPEPAVAVSGGTFDGSLTYPDHGEFEVRVCITDDDDGQTCRQQTAEVINPPPVVTASTTSIAAQYSDAIPTVTVTGTDIPNDTLTVATSWKTAGAAGTSPGLPSGLSLDGSCSPAYQCTWELTGDVGVAAGDYVVTVTVTDDEGDSTSVDIELAVAAEDARADVVTTDVAVEVDGSDDDADAVTILVEVREIVPDTAAVAAAPGDIDNAVLTAVAAPVGPGGSVTGTCSPTGVTGTGYDAVLTVSCTFADVPVNVYSVGLTIGGGYYTGAGEDLFVVFDPALGFTTGGGWFYWPGTADVATGYAGDRTNFGYTTKYKKKGNGAKGNLLMIRHLPDGTKYRVKSNALDALALGETATYGWASFTGKATYLEPGWSDAVGNHAFTVYVEDHGEPGRDDRFWIQVRDKARDVVDAGSLATPASSNAVTLEGGNIQVPQGSRR